MSVPDTRSSGRSSEIQPFGVTHDMVRSSAVNSMICCAPAKIPDLVTSTMLSVAWSSSAFSCSPAWRRSATASSSLGSLTHCFTAARDRPDLAAASRKRATRSRAPVSKNGLDWPPAAGRLASMSARAITVACLLSVT